MKIEEKLSATVSDIVHKIEELSFYTKFFRNAELVLEDFATELQVPLSHIN